MSYLDAMLDKNSLEKLTVYTKVLQLPQQMYSIAALANFLALSYNKAKFLLYEIAVDLKKIKKENYSFQTSSNTIFIHAWLPTQEEYQSYLIVNALPYKYLLACLLENEDNFSCFAAANFISPSTAKRRLQLLKSYLKRYNIEMLTTHFQLQGDERLIRLSLLFILWWSDHGTNSQLKQAGDKATQVLWEITPLHPEESTAASLSLRQYLVEIFSLRIRNQHFVSDCPAYEFVLENNFNTDCQSPLAIFSPWLPENCQLAEARFIGFLGFYGPALYKEVPALLDYLNRKSPKIPWEIAYFRDIALPELLDKLFPCWQNRPKSTIIQANLLTNFFSYYVFQCPLPAFSTLSGLDHCPDGQLFQELIDQLRGFFQRLSSRKVFHWLQYCLEDLTTQCAVLLFPEYEYLKKSQQLYVALVFECSFPLSQKLENFLDALSFVQRLPFVKDSLAQADVVITSAPQLIQALEIKDSLLFPATFAEDCYFDLAQELKQRHSKKFELSL